MTAVNHDGLIWRFPLLRPALAVGCVMVVVAVAEVADGPDRNRPPDVGAIVASWVVGMGGLAVAVLFTLAAIRRLRVPS